MIIYHISFTHAAQHNFTKINNGIDLVDIGLDRISFCSLYCLFCASVCYASYYFFFGTLLLNK